MAAEKIKDSVLWSVSNGRRCGCKIGIGSAEFARLCSALAEHVELSDADECDLSRIGFITIRNFDYEASPESRLSRIRGFIAWLTMIAMLITFSVGFYVIVVSVLAIWRAF